MRKSVSEIQISEQHFAKIMTRNNKGVEITRTTKRIQQLVDENYCTFEF